MTNLILPANFAAAFDDALADGLTTSDLSNYRLLDAQYGMDTDAHPDFAALFPASTCTASLDEQLVANFFCEDDCCAAGTLTPRQAFAMHDAAVTFLDFAYDPDDPDSWYLADVLPRVCAPFVHQPTWGLQLRHVFHLLAGRIATGQLPTPRSTAEEMALHIVLDNARDSVHDGLFDGYADFQALPVLPADVGGGFEDLRDWLFEDHDVLLLFSPSLDGIEDSDIANMMGAVNLHPAQWFKPFRERDHVEAELLRPAPRAARAVYEAELIAAMLREFDGATPASGDVASPDADTNLQP